MPDRDPANPFQEPESQFPLQLWVIPIIASLILFVVSYYNFLFFHTLAELFAIGVALLMCVVAWQMYPFTRNNYLMYLGLGYFWVGVLDLMHTFSYEGVQIHSLVGANYSTQYWIATRYIESILLLTAPWFLNHKLYRRTLFAVYGLISVAVMLTISWGVFPQSYIYGVGLTPFKITSEYIIITLLSLSLPILWQRREYLESSILKMIMASIVLTAAAEFTFTFYIKVHDFSNIAGHIFKFFSYWLIFVATVHSTLKKPFMALARSANTYDVIPDPTVVTDNKGVVCVANQAACTLAGLKKKDLIGQSSHKIFHPSYVREQDCFICKSVRDSEYLNSYEAHFPENNKWRDYTVSPMQGGALEVMRDITEKKFVEEQFQSLNKLKQTIVESLPAILFVKTADEGRYIEWNKTAEVITGLPKDVVLGKTDFDLFPDDAEQFVSIDKKVIESGKLHIIPEENLTSRHNGMRILHTQKIPVFDDKGRPAYLLGISIDITEKRNTEKMLQHSQKMEAIGQLAGGIAHDFNNQLGLLIGYLDFIGERLVGDEKAKEWLDICSKAANRCVELTSQLLMFSRKHAGNQEVIDVNERIQEISAMIERSLTASTTIEYELAKEPLLTVTNAGELQDAILNLAINAHDAMPSGGKFIIKTQIVNFSNDAMLLPNIKPGDYVQISLLDSGSGMDESTQQYIFEPFFTTKPVGKGTGLGLAMVYAFVHRNNGTITVDSELGKGTTFNLFLPLVDIENQETVNNLDSMYEEYSGKECILAVDDEKGLLTLIKAFLTDAGYAVITSSEASQALEILKDNSAIQLLISDIVMPGGMDGFELARKATELRPDIRVLLTSGYAAEAPESDKNYYWTKSIMLKPYKKQDVLKSVRQVLDAELG